MKIYISADFESATGAVSGEQMTHGRPGYEETRRLWMGDLNAAIEGAIEGGATGILVNEAHYPVRNILPELLHQDAEFITGYLKLGNEVEGVENMDGVFMFTHSMAGTENGVLSHTFLGREIYGVWLNDRKVGELAINAAVAGYYDVPIILVVGDSAVGYEAKELLGDDVVTVSLKDGIDRYTARCITPMKRAICLSRKRRRRRQNLLRKPNLSRLTHRSS